MHLSLLRSKPLKKLRMLFLLHALSSVCIAWDTTFITATLLANQEIVDARFTKCCIVGMYRLASKRFSVTDSPRLKYENVRQAELGVCTTIDHQIRFLQRNYVTKCNI